MYQNYEDRKFLIQNNKSTRRPLKIAGFYMVHPSVQNQCIWEIVHAREGWERADIINSLQGGFLYKNCQPEMEIF